MDSIYSRSGKLYLDFRYQEKRCRKQTFLPETTANKRNLFKLMSQIDADIRPGCFVCSEYFPDSKKARLFVKEDNEAKSKKNELLGAYKTASQQVKGIETIRFEDFAMEWYEENEVRWKESYKGNMRIYLHNYLIPYFDDTNIDQISKADILKYRAQLAKPSAAKTLSADFINHVMTPLRMILNEGADRYGFRPPFENIKQLRVEKRDVNPFSLEEVMRFIAGVRIDYRHYYTARFFTGMRSSEIDGLKWKYVNFKLRTITIRKTYVHGRTETAKTLGSARDIHMSSIVFEAFQAQFRVTGAGEYVFCNGEGNPLDKGNVRERVWKPTLRKLGMKYRRPYETRHTAATLWLASGEAPEWIARQMGHTTTKMLFEIYSCFVPNLTRQDGSAFEKLIQQAREEDEV